MMRLQEEAFLPVGGGGNDLTVSASGFNSLICDHVLQLEQTNRKHSPDAPQRILMRVKRPTDRKSVV